MRKPMIVTALMMVSLPVLAQGFLDFSWTAGSGIRLNNPPSQAGWYVAGDYSVQAFMAAGSGVAESSLVPIAAARTTFLGGATTTASGSPGSDGSGLWFAGAQDTGLATGAATIEVRAWYDPNHNSS